MILIIGYGNPLRGDDAIGQRIAERISRHSTRYEVRVLTAYQLTPELVEPISHAQLVVFIDARVDQVVGEILLETVEPLHGAGAFTHNVSPAALLGAARILYGVTPDGLLISIAGTSFDYSGELSPELSLMLPMMTKQVQDIIDTHARATIEKETHHA